MAARDPPSGADLDDLTYLDVRRLWPDAGKHPCRSSCLPRANIRSRGHLHDQIEQILAPGTCLADLLRELGEPFGSGEIDWEQAVPSDRPPDWPAIGPVPRDPDGDPRALYRPRVESPAPESVEPLKAIIQHSRPLTRVDDLPERLKVVSVAEPDAQRETSVAEMVQRDRLAGDLLDPPAGQRSDHRSEPERLGHHSNGAERHPRVSQLIKRRQVQSAFDGPLPTIRTVCPDSSSATQPTNTT